MYVYGGEDEDYSETFVGKLQLKTDHYLCFKDQKLLSNVADYNALFGGLPVIITRTDGTTWLYDWDEPDPESDLRKRIDPPQKLTEELVASLYDGSAVPSKKTQTISGASAFTKTYGDKAFNLGAKASGGGTLTYKSSNTKVASVDSAGKVTLKGLGKAAITITAGETAQYKAASKIVEITVKAAQKPKKMAAPQVKSAKAKTLTVSWKKDTKASGYQVIIAQNSKFTKGKKKANIGSNKTTSATFKKLAKGKTYCAKVRAYKKVGTTKLYGAYSSVKKLRVK